MPISADQWRAVTGINNVRRPRQVGIKPRYMQQEPCGDNEKLSHHPEPDANQDIARGGTGSKIVPLGNNGSSRGRKDQSRPVRDKVKDESRSTWVDGDHDNFISVMTSSVMGVQILVSVVMMLLLLLSGDVETNPGPSLPFNPYDLMVECSEKIIHGLSGEPKKMATSLLEKRFIADGTLDDTFQLVHETNTDKGRRLYAAVLEVIRNYPQRYSDFISLLEQNRSQYDDLLKVLDTREKVHTQVSSGGKRELEKDTSVVETKKEKSQSEISTSGVQSTPADHPDNQSGGVPTHELPYCAIPLSPPEVEGQPSQKREMQQQQNAASGQMSRDKMWSREYDTLHVYFMNPGDLAGVSLNTQNIIDWAKIWEHPSYPQIPKFRETKEERKANIRVKFIDGGGSRAEVGIEALKSQKGDPTMWLDLQKGKNDYNKHIVIHEFGHALGLEHEHQRSCFWSVASKFLDVEQMKADPELKGTNIDHDYLERQTQGVEYETEYDPDSVMHYWFKLEWMKDPKYREEHGIEADKSLVEKDKKILKGICTRQLKLAEKPSNIDYTFLAKHYGASTSDTDNGASQSSSVLNGGSGLPVKNSAAGHVSRESGSSEASDVEEVDGPRRKPQHRSIDTSISPGSTSCKPSSSHSADQSQQSEGTDTSISPGSTGPKPSSSHSTDQSQQSEGTDTSISPGSTNPNPFSGPSPDQSQQSEPILQIPLGNTEDTVQQAIAAIEVLANEMGRQDITEKLGEIADRMNSSSALKMGVIGTTNSGKTTTLNALLGKNLLPASFKPHTASLVCIKHDAELPAAVLYGLNPSINEPEKLDLEEHEICGFIEEEYIKQRSSSGSPPSFTSFELHVPIPFLEGNKKVGLEIYDTPGTSEAGNNAIYTEIAEHAREKLDGIILILAADSAYLKSSTTLLQSLTDKYPLLMNRKEKRILLLVNKYDLMYDDRNPSLSDERQQLVEEINVSAEDQPERINVAPEDIEFFSSKLGLQAKIFKNDPNSVNKDCFDQARALLLSLPLKERARPICFSTDGSVKKLGEVLECSSRIGVVETLLKHSCIHYRSSILMKKAIDETQCQVRVLRDHAEQEIKKLSVQKTRYEMISQQLLERFPEEVNGELSTLLSIHVSSFITAMDSSSNTQLGMLIGTNDSRDFVSQFIDIVRTFLISVAKLKLSDSFWRAINELQASFSILFGQSLDQLTEDLSIKVEGGNTIEIALETLEKFQHPTFDPDIEGHKSIDTGTLHSYIIEDTETRKRNVRKYIKVPGKVPFTEKEIKTLVTEAYPVTVYKLSINDLNASLQQFSKYCGDFLREKIEAVVNEQMQIIVNKAVAEVLKLSGQSECERWLEDGQGETKRCDEQIELWKNRKASLDEAEKRLEEI